MSEYGSCVSMKEAIRMNMTKVKAALDRTNITDEDRNTVIGILKGAFYIGARCNAAARVMDEYIETHADYKEFSEQFIFSGKMEKEVAELYPEEFDKED